MSAAGPPIDTRSGISSLLGPRTMAMPTLPPAAIRRWEPAAPSAPARRSKIWEFNTNLHCSIVGTCLCTRELRQILKKLGLAPPESTDHELHGTAVTLAGRHDIGAKLLHKALDLCHRTAVNQFAKARNEDEVRVLWREAVRRGEIPGAYWAVLTHPATTPKIVREAFGEVDMLSHLVGSANRADIRRLCQLEADKAELETRLERQQIALCAAVVTRDEQIQELRRALAQKIAAEAKTASSYATEETLILRQLVADLERRLARETKRRVAADERREAAQTIIADERSARARVERERDAGRQELDAIEASMVSGLLSGWSCETVGTGREASLDGVVLLYVGGRPNQAAHLRAVSERLGATFLHHDGGIENHQNLLPGLARRADLVLFPVDCISHDAASTVKSLCRQGGKRFIPPRSASVTSLLAALRPSEVTGLLDAAD